MSKSCKGLAVELVKCLSETDCIKVIPRMILLRVVLGLGFTFCGVEVMQWAAKFLCCPLLPIPFGTADVLFMKFIHQGFCFYG